MTMVISDGSAAKKGLAEIQGSGIAGALRPRGPKATASRVGRAAISQEDSIEPENRRVPTSRTEYWTYVTFCFAQLGTGIGTDGGALRQALTSMAWPTGVIHWGNREIPLHSILLDLNGLLFAIQLVVLLGLGSYADYGRWRYFLLIAFDASLITCMIGLSTLKQAASWKIAQAFWMVGCISSNILGTFFCASFPELVRNLPRMLASELAVKAGEKTPQEHAEMDMFERATILNWVNTVGSASVVAVSAIAVLISETLGTEPSQLVTTYRVLLVYFATMTLAFSLPYFIAAKRRPGAKMPKGAKWYSLGPKQFYLGATHLPYLRQCLLYLLGYFCMVLACDTSGGLIGIVQNEVIDYSPRALNTFAMLGSMAGGCGTFACLLAQRRWRFTIKQGCTYGACTAIVPSIWGAIGNYTDKVGYHNKWEFWLVQLWNLQTASWGSYNVTMISEVAPAPKMFMFFALFNTVGKTGGFIGPWAASYVIARSGGNTNAAFIFCSIVGLLGVFLIWCVDTDQAKVDNAALLRREDLGSGGAEASATEVTPLLDSIPEQQ